MLAEEAIHNERLDADLVQRLERGLAVTAHEVRSPLLAAGAAIESVAGKDALSDRDRERLDLARRDLADLSQVVDSLLHWVAGEPRLRRRRADMGEIAREAVRWATLATPRARVTLRAPRAPLRLKADPVSLRLALANLIRNAVAYAPATDPVRVTVTAANDVARVHVTDHGPGMLSDEHSAVLRPFFRGRGAAAGGHGLGLFIARKVVEAHGGAIRVSSRAGRTRLTVDIPAPSDGGEA